MDKKGNVDRNDWSVDGQGTSWEIEEAGRRSDTQEPARPQLCKLTITSVESDIRAHRVHGDTITNSDNEQWVLVKSHKKTQREQWKMTRKYVPKVAKAQREKECGPTQTATTAGKPTVMKRRPPRKPRHVAVMITANKESFSCAQVLKDAREKISLTDIGLEETTLIRKAINGGILIQIPGVEEEKANKLMTHIQQIVQDSTISQAL